MKYLQDEVKRLLGRLKHLHGRGSQRGVDKLFTLSLHQLQPLKRQGEVRKRVGAIRSSCCLFVEMLYRGLRSLGG